MKLWVLSRGVAIHQLLNPLSKYKYTPITNIYYTVHCIEVRKYGQLEYQLGQCCHSDTVRLVNWYSSQFKV